MCLPAVPTPEANAAFSIACLILIRNFSGTACLRKDLARTQLKITKSA